MAPPPPPIPSSPRALPGWLDALRKHRSLIVPIAFIGLMAVLLMKPKPAEAAGDHAAPAKEEKKDKKEGGGHGGG